MEGIGKHLVVEEIKEDRSTALGLSLSSAESKGIRYRTGKVVAIGDECGKIKIGDTILYDSAQGFKTIIKSNPLLVLNYSACALIL